MELLISLLKGNVCSILRARMGLAGIPPGPGLHRLHTLHEREKEMFVLVKPVFQGSVTCSQTGLNCYSPDLCGSQSLWTGLM